MALLFACGGNAVDLGQRDKTGFADLEDAPPASAGGEPAPQTIYDGDARLVAYTIDETKLYALFDTPDDHGSLLSCPLDRCRSERQILAQGVGSYGSLSSSTPLFLVSDKLFWIYGEGYPGRGVAMCSTSGCASPTLAESPRLTGDLAADADHIYWVDDDGWLMRWGTDGSAAARLRDLNQPIEVDGPLIASIFRIAVAGDYVYFLQDNLGLGTPLSRVRKDGSAEPELLQVLADGASSIGATTTDAYYTESSLAGSVRVLPAAGGSERVVASNQRWPLSLQIDRDEAFWVNRLQPQTDPPPATLVSCILPECAAPKTRVSQFMLTGAGSGFSVPDASHHLALSSRWLVWIERGANFGSKLKRIER